MCFFLKPLHAMETNSSQLSKRVRMPEQLERYKSDIVWIKTKDNVLLELAQWQIDQMKALKQEGQNSKENPFDASIIDSEDMLLIQQALNKVSNLEKFRDFCSNLSQDQQTSLVAGAFTLEMQGLASLLLTYIAPKEVQALMGASIIQPAGVIAPVINYLKSVQEIELPHTRSIKYIALSPDNKRLISGALGVDHNLILYDVQQRKEIKNLYEDNFIVSCVAFSPDGKYIVTGANRLFDNLIIWNGATGEQIKICDQFKDGHVRCVAFSADSKYMVAGSYQNNGKNTLLLFDVQTWDVIQSFDGPKNDIDGSYMNISSVAFHPSGEYIIVGSPQYHHVMVCDAKSGAIIRTFDGLSDGFTYVAVSPDGRYLAAGSSNKERLIYHSNCLLWNLQTGALIKDMEFGFPVSCITFGPNGKYIAIGSFDVRGHIEIKDGKTGNNISFESTSFRFTSAISNFLGQALSLTFSSDSNYLFCPAGKNVAIFKVILPDMIKTIATQLNIAQAALLYRWYIAHLNNIKIVVDEKDLDYQIFKTLPFEVQKTIKAYLPFQVVSDIVKKIKKERDVALEKEIQDKMNAYRSSLFYQTAFLFSQPFEKSFKEKMKAVKEEMQKLDKNSTDYQACARLLAELEQEAAFEI